MPNQVERQLEIIYRSHGGKRRGAGRKPQGARACVSRHGRESFDAWLPVLVTVRVQREVWNLRRRRAYQVIREAIAKGNERDGFAVVEYAVIGNHLHFVIEAKGSRSLSRGMQGLKIRMARGLNRLMRRVGRVFSDRFHSRVLRTPREVKNALAYVLNNARRHGIVRRAAGFWIDPYSSGTWFPGWKRGTQLPNAPPKPTAEAETWLLSLGWRRHGLLDPAFVPG